MLLFPIVTTEESKDTCCRFIPLSDNDYRLSFWQNGKERLDLRAATDPKENEYALLDSAVSGGMFHDFLSDAMDRFNGRVCLYLRPIARRFSLPCPDGVGNALSPCEQSGGSYSYSDALCCLWRISCLPEPYIDLTDSSFTMHKKYEIAKSCGIPILILESAILQKMKAPCKQGALDLIIEERDQ